VPVDEDFADALGIPENSGELIQGVQPGEAAEKAGLKAGDVVVSVNGQAVTRDESLSYIVSNIAPGTRVPVEFIRDGERDRVTLTVGRRPSREEMEAQQFNPDAEEPEPPQSEKESALIENVLGLRVREIDPIIARQLGNADYEGLVILAVDSNADAARKGLSRGMVIETANYQPVLTQADLEAQIRAVREDGRDAILMRVNPRNQPSRIVAIRLRSGD